MCRVIQDETQLTGDVATGLWHQEGIFHLMQAVDTRDILQKVGEGVNEQSWGHQSQGDSALAVSTFDER